jgi:two-component system, NarL family, sensor kinase
MNLGNYPNPDTARVEALINVLNAAILLKERKDVAPYLSEAFSLCRKLQYINGLGKCFLQRGLYYKSASEYQAALIHLDSALYISEYSNTDSTTLLKAKVLMLMANIYYIQENYYTSLNYYLEALKHTETDDIERRSTIYVYITRIYTYLNNLPKAEEYAEKNISEVEKLSKQNDKNFIYFSVVDLYLEKNDLPLASYYLDKLSHVTDNPAQVQEIFGYFLKRGRISYLQSQFEKAFTYFKDAYKYALTGGHSASKSTALYHLAATALKLGYNIEAKKFAEDNLKIANEMDTKSAKIEALINLSDYYYKIGNTNQALQLTREAFSLKDTVIAENKTNQLKILGTMYESQKQQREISKLQLEKEKSFASESKKSFINKVLSAAVVALLFVIYLAFNNFKRGRQLSKQQQEIQQQRITELQTNKQLLTIEAMLNVQEEERSRIAKDLHDGIGSLLSGTKLSLLNVKEKMAISPDDKILFQKSLGLLDTTIGDLRKVAQNLMPEALTKFGLQEALKDYCDHVQYSSGINVVSIQLPQKRTVDNTAQVYIYRIIQELVNNVVKHAAAKNIIVQLSVQEDRTTLVVEDDGKGFDLASLSGNKGSGISNIMYRVQYFNGTIDISSSPGNGTSINIELMA